MAEKARAGAEAVRVFKEPSKCRKSNAKGPCMDSLSKEPFHGNQRTL